MNIEIFFNKKSKWESVIIDSCFFFFKNEWQKLALVLTLLWSIFNDSIKFNEIDHQKYRIMQSFTCRTYHSWKSDSIQLESVEIACSFFLVIRLFPYSVDDFDSYSNKLCESLLERIRFGRYIGIFKIVFNLFAFI